LLHSFAELKDFLKGRDIPIAFDDARQAVEIPTYIRSEAHSAVILWDPRAILLQVIQPLHVEVPLEYEGRIADAITRINHQLVLPGFGYDHERHAVYFRWVVPREADGSLSEDALDRAIRTVLQSARDFLPGLRAVAAGQTPAAEVVAYSMGILEQERQPPT